MEGPRRIYPDAGFTLWRNCLLTHQGVSIDRQNASPRLHRRGLWMFGHDGVCPQFRIRTSSRYRVCRVVPTPIALNSADQPSFVADIYYWRCGSACELGVCLAALG